MRVKILALVAVLAAALVMCLGGGTAGAAGPVTGLHFTANGNFDSAGHYAPGAYGFNVADVGSKSTLDGLPSGVKGMAWLGKCSGADAAFQSAVNAYKGDSRLFGFYVQDDADPTGKWGPLCTAANLRAESDYVHANLPGVKMFLLPMNLSSSKSPSFDASYAQSSTHIDLYGLDPYPCRTELGGCNLDMINGYVGAAEKVGIPQSAIVPVYQAFGLGGWVDDGGGQYAVPTATQEQQILDRWATLTPSPVFDYAYSWGVQNSDEALSTITALQPVFAAHNGAAAPSSSSPTPKPTPTSPTPTPTPTKTPACVLVWQ